MRIYGSVTERVCNRCGISFSVPTYSIKHGKGKFCSAKCSSQQRQGTPKDRLYRRIIKSKTGCWEWMGTRHSNGYGVMRWSQRGTKSGLVTTHRASWIIHFGEIPDGLCVIHRCDNRRCVNPYHLSLGTIADNVRDCVTKNRHAYGDRNGNRLHPELVNRGESHGMAKLTEIQVKRIRKLYSSGKTQLQIASMFEIKRTHVQQITSRRTWRYI